MLQKSGKERRKGRYKEEILNKIESINQSTINNQSKKVQGLTLIEQTLQLPLHFQIHTCDNTKKATIDIVAHASGDARWLAAIADASLMMSLYEVCDQHNSILACLFELLCSPHDPASTYLLFSIVSLFAVELYLPHDPASTYLLFQLVYFFAFQTLNS